MIVRTKKYQLSTEKYIGLALGVFKQQWWVILIYIPYAQVFFYS